MDVSICIVNWNTRELLCACIESIRARTTGLQYEIVVVDNDSSDGTVETVRSKFPDVKLIASASNLGFARGCNLAVAHAVGRHILYLNPDTEIVTNAVYGMSQVLDESPEIGAVGCRLLNSDGSVQYTCACAAPSARNELCALLGLDRIFSSTPIFSARELAYWDHEDNRDVECLSGACVMMRRELVDVLGGLDESTFMYGEDVDLCVRVAKTGARVHYLASEKIYHHEGSGSRKRGRDFAPMRQRNANCYVLEKHQGRGSAFRYRLAVFAGSCIRCASAAIVLPLTLFHRPAYDRVLHAFQRYGNLALWAIKLRSPRDR